MMLSNQTSGDKSDDDNGTPIQLARRRRKARALWDAASTGHMDSPPHIEKLQYDDWMPTSLSLPSIHRRQSRAHGRPPLKHQERPRKIYLYVNGDKHFVPKPQLVDRVADLDHFLELIASKMPRSVIPRRLYELESGRRVRFIDSLEDGRNYVVANNEPFKRVPYEGIKTLRAKELEHRRQKFEQYKRVTLEQLRDGTLRPGAMKFGPMNGMLPPVAPPKKAAPSGGRIKDALKHNQPKTVYFIRNGDERNECVPLLLSTRNANTFSQVCQRLSSKLRMEAPCRWIYTLSGMPVESVQRLEHQATYVAVGRIAFKQVGYKPASLPQRLQKNQGANAGNSHSEGGRRQKPIANVFHRHNGSQGRRPPGAPSELPSMPAGRKSLAADLDRPPEIRKQRRKRAASQSVDVGKLQHTYGPTRTMKTYEILTFTGSLDNAGTDAKIYLNLIGSLGETGRILLREDETQFGIGSKSKSDFDAPDVGQILSAEITNENDGASADSSAWWLEHLVVVDRTATTQQSVVKHYFWFNRWLNDDAGLNATATSTFMDTAESAAAERLAQKKIEVLGGIVDDVRPYADVVAAVEALCRDGREVRRQWRAMDVDGLGFVQAHHLWQHVRDLFIELNIRVLLEHAFKKVFKVREVGETSMAIKAGLRQFLLTTVYACVVYEIVGFPAADEFNDRSFTREELDEVLGKCREDLTDADKDNVFYRLAHEDGLVRLPELINWYVDLSFPDDIPSSLSKKKRKKDRKKDKRDRKSTDAPADGAPPEQPDVATGDERHPLLPPTSHPPPAVVITSEDSGSSPAHDHPEESDESKQHVAPDNSTPDSHKPLDHPEQSGVIKNIDESDSGIQGRQEESEATILPPVVEETIADPPHTAPPPSPGSTREPADVSYASQHPKETPTVTAYSTSANRSEDIASWEAFEAFLLKTESNRDRVDELWRQIVHRDNADRVVVSNGPTATLGDVLLLLTRAFPHLAPSQPALHRAYACVTNTLRDSLYDSAASVSRTHFLPLLIYYCCFNIFFTVFNGLEEDSAMEIDMVRFQKALASDLHLVVPPAELGGAFDAMDSNDGNGNVVVDEVCVWYARKRFPVGTVVSESPTTTTDTPVVDPERSQHADNSTSLNREATFTSASPSIAPETNPSVDGAASLAKLSDLVSSGEQLWTLWKTLSKGTGAVGPEALSKWLCATHAPLNADSVVPVAMDIGAPVADGASVDDSLRINVESFVDVLSALYAHLHAQEQSGLSEHDVVSKDKFAALCAVLLSHEPLLADEISLEYNDLAHSADTHATDGGESTAAHPRTEGGESEYSTTAGAVHAWYAERSLMDNSVAMATVEFRRCQTRDEALAEQGVSAHPSGRAAKTDENAPRARSSLTSRTSTRRSLPQPRSDDGDVASRGTGRDSSRCSRGSAASLSLGPKTAAADLNVLTVPMMSTIWHHCTDDHAPRGPRRDGDAVTTKHRVREVVMKALSNISAAALDYGLRQIEGPEVEQSYFVDLVFTCAAADVLLLHAGTEDWRCSITLKTFKDILFDASVFLPPADVTDAFEHIRTRANADVVLLRDVADWFTPRLLLKHNATATRTAFLEHATRETASPSPEASSQRTTSNVSLFEE
eukprot:m.32476 g.32476  ORF g.32476 m.32476 type:complete len:1614 (+) comp14130_c0_seq1:211-5052(+)